ncbi:ABC transporter permease [Allokutzneria multivorans]|uniref:ABC transporter permease n=1 Tax=Allokutzneria multivorans TaxID=1142134 RepID=UPI0031E9FEF5
MTSAIRADVSVSRTARTARHVVALSRRNLLQLRAEPLRLVDATVMPMVLSLIFLYLFGGAISKGQGEYVLYLMPGMMVEAIAFASRATGIGLNLDFATGIMDRFHAMPIARSAVLGGRITADVVRMAVALAVMFAFALVVGFRVQTGPVEVLAAVLLLLAFGSALCWVSAYVGLLVRSPQAVGSVGFLWMIPLQFGSSMFVPPVTMPGWLQAFAAINPVTSVCDAARGLLTGGPVAQPVLLSLAWIVGLTAVFAPLAVRRYTRRS